MKQIWFVLMGLWILQSCSNSGSVVVKRNLSKSDVYQLAKDLNSPIIDSTKIDLQNFQLRSYFGGAYSIQNQGDSAIVHFDYDGSSQYRSVRLGYPVRYDSRYSLTNLKELKEETKLALFPIVLQASLEKEYSVEPQSKSILLGGALA